MSGVAAVFFRDGAPVRLEGLERLGAGIARCGPDGSESWHHGPAGLVHAHFWTTPEEHGERQPVHLGHRLWVSADLRLDNRDELCAKLGNAVDRRTATDAEILLAAYDRWAEDCPRHLVGDFAFALWDAPRRRLFCARDPLGVRPLYYALDPRLLIVASTVEAVLASSSAPAETNEPFLRDLLAWRFERWNTETPYQGVLRLPPAHRLMVEERRVVLSRYWALGEDPPPPLRRDEEHIERFREVFLGVVQAHLRSAGPVGFLVSGGLDSSSIACAAEHLAATGALRTSSDLRLYSCVFHRTPGAQEREYAEAVARRCVRMRAAFLPSDDCWGLREFADENGYPLAEPEASVSRALVLRPMRAARAEGCRVVLTGIGGDQVLGGEPYHTPAMLRDVEWRRLPAEIPHFRHWSRKTTAALLFDGYFRPAARRLIRGGSIPPSRLSTRAAQVSYRYLTEGAFTARLGSLRTAADHAGVEARLPFLDRRLVELLFALPGRLRFRDGWIKWILRQSLGSLLPEEVRQRTKLAYFSELEHRGLRSEAKSTVLGLMADSQLVRSGLVSAVSLRKDWEEYWSSASRFAPPRKLIGFLCAESWMRSRSRTPVQQGSRPRISYERLPPAGSMDHDPERYERRLA